jgi:hypothetical protein
VRFARRFVAFLLLGFALVPANASASPIITIYTSESALLATLPPGVAPADVIIAEEEFLDSVFDTGVTPTGGSPTFTNCLGGPGFGCWDTIGPLAFFLNSGSADGFGIAYYAPFGATAQAVPTVTLTLVGGSPFVVGPLAGGADNGGFFFALTSTERFTGVSISLPGQDAFTTDAVAFFNQPAIPEPGTWLLLATGLLVAAGRLRHTRR